MTEINMSLLNDFIDESREYLDEMESLLLQLAGDLENLEILNDIFRTMHNIKGGSQLTGLDKISKLSHRLEDLLDQLREGQIKTNSAIVDMLIAGRDRIVQLINELEESQQETSLIEDLIDQLMVLMEAPETKSDETLVDVAVIPQEIAVEPQPAFEADAVPTVDYDESHDKELFRIFVEHLQSQLIHLASQVAKLAVTPDKAEGLAHCSNMLKGLRSSANYMGYVDLTRSYEAWDAALALASQAASHGETVSLDFMDDYFDELVGTFPQLEDPRIVADAAASETIDDIPVPEATDDVTASVFDAFENAFNEAIERDEKEPTEEAMVEGSTTILDEFVDEAREYLDEMEALLLILSGDLGNVGILNDIFRGVHNIKGSSQLMGLEKISVLSHRLEDLLDLLRQGKKKASLTTIEVLIAGRDRIVQLINELEESQEEISSVDDIAGQLMALLEDSAPDAPADTAVISQGAPERDSQKTSQEILQGSTEGASSEFNYNEENDQELFGIFIEHIRGQLVFLVAQTEQINVAPNKIDCLTRCSESVRSLQSSANYMDYTELAHIYEQWRSEIEQASQMVSRGEVPSLGFMYSNFDKLLKIFPQVEDPRGVTTVVEPVTKPTIDSIVEPIVEPIVDQPKNAPLTDNVHEVVSKQQENELFEKLNNTLESSLQKTSNSERETLNDVFDEMVSLQKAGTVATKGSAPKQVVSSQPEPMVPPQQKIQEPVEGKSVKKKPLKQEVAKKDAAKSGKSPEKTIKKSIRVDAEKIDTLMNQVGELVVDRSYFFLLFKEMRELQQHLKDIAGIDQRDVKLVRAFTYKLSEAISGLGRTSNELQESVMKMRMLPISHIFNRYPRLVHDLTNNTDKKVNLVVRGEDTELDKMIVEEISDPLLHIIRNAIDHGLEAVDERRQIGKSETCTLLLEAYQESNHIVIEITDDGRGINLERVKTKAVEKGLFQESEVDKMSNRDLTNIILMPGFSTAEKITGTSGRGVGMDVVKRNIEKLNGLLEIETAFGKGTRMRLKIPLTLAIIHALMVRVGEDLFTIPLANVDETVRINKAETSIIEGVEVIHLRGVSLPIFRLSNLFNVKTDSDIDKSFVVIVSAEGKRTGFVVDELMGQEEVVIKPLADYVQRKSGFSGATIVGDGRISLILDIYDLVKMTAMRQIQRHKDQMVSMKIDMDHRSDGGEREITERI